MLFNAYHSMAQELDNKYLLSVIYIERNAELNKEVRDFFKRDISKKSKVIPYHISDEILFIDISQF